MRGIPAWAATCAAIHMDRVQAGLATQLAVAMACYGSYVFLSSENDFAIFAHGSPNVPSPFSFSSVHANTRARHDPDGHSESSSTRNLGVAHIHWLRRPTLEPFCLLAQRHSDESPICHQE